MLVPVAQRFFLQFQFNPEWYASFLDSSLHPNSRLFLSGTVRLFKGVPYHSNGGGLTVYNVVRTARPLNKFFD
jgi:hypothetical protein